MKDCIVKKYDKNEIKNKVLNSDLFITDLDGTIADLNIKSPFRLIKTYCAHYLKKAENLFNHAKTKKIEIAHNVYPSFKDILDFLKSKKIIITRNTPNFAEPLAELLGFDKVYYGNNLPSALLDSFEIKYKKIIFAGNSMKDYYILKKLKNMENGPIDYCIGIWITKDKINENFDINLLNKNWGGLLDFLRN